MKTTENSLEMRASYEIKWLNKALENLDMEAGYIARENPQAAINVVNKIYGTVSLLAENPALGHPGRIHGTRELIIPDTRYLVPYRVNTRLSRIEILRIFHTSRQWPSKW